MKVIAVGTFFIVYMFALLYSLCRPHSIFLLFEEGFSFVHSHDAMCGL